MKIGIVGTGMVGATCAYALIQQGIGSELVLVDLNTKRALAEAADLLHAVPFSEAMRVKVGTYADLAGARVVLLAAGVSQKPGETRPQLLARNEAVFREVVPQVLAHAPQAVLVVATNPVDTMTHLTARIAVEHGAPECRVMGTGTMLDTARFRSLVGQWAGVDSHHIHANVLGEHGDSEVLAWSAATVGGIPLEAFGRECGLSLDEAKRQEIDQATRRAAYTIIEGKGATYYGVAAAMARLVEVILHDRHSILTVCAPLAEVEGVRDVTLSLPRLIGAEGVLATFRPPLTDGERQALQNSAGVIRGMIDELHQA
jgi:L-lactate dehydrogenase